MAFDVKTNRNAIEQLTKLSVTYINFTFVVSDRSEDQNKNGAFLKNELQKIE